MKPIGACLCFKDSAAYLEEWLLFHYVQGIRRFYLYDNESSDDWGSIVTPWIKDGIVTATRYPGKGVQGEIYDHCLQRARGEVEWLAFIDDDEFLFPCGGESLPDLLADYTAYAGLAVSWVLLGSAGAERTSREWVIRRFTGSAGGADAHVKCVVRPERVVRSRVIGHSFEPVLGFQIVDENQRPLTEPQNPAPSAARVRINHYLIKSWEEWRFRRSRPQANTGQPTPLPESSWREWDRQWSGVRDESALRFLGPMEELKKQRARC
jgi:Glycosyltransferase family 92